MKLATWLKKRGRGSIEALARAAGISRGAVKAGARGDLTDVAVAKSIEAATGGEVTVVELTFAVEPKQKSA